MFPMLILVFWMNAYYMGNHGIMPLRLTRQRQTWLNCVYTFLVAGVYFPLVYIMPIYFQAVQGVSAQQSGIRNIPLVVGMSLFTIASTSFMGRTKQWMIPFAVSSLIIVTGFAAVYTLGIESPSKEWIGQQTLFGVRVGISM